MGDAEGETTWVEIERVGRSVERPDIVPFKGRLVDVDASVELKDETEVEVVNCTDSPGFIDVVNAEEVEV